MSSLKIKYKNNLVIMDNAAIHKSKIIKTIENRKNELLYSVPYHPEINSIDNSRQFESIETFETIRDNPYNSKQFETIRTIRDIRDNGNRDNPYNSRQSDSKQNIRTIQF